MSEAPFTEVDERALDSAVRLNGEGGLYAFIVGIGRAVPCPCCMGPLLAIQALRVMEAASGKQSMRPKKECAVCFGYELTPRWAAALGRWTPATFDKTTSLNGVRCRLPVPRCWREGVTIHSSDLGMALKEAGLDPFDGIEGV